MTTESTNPFEETELILDDADDPEVRVEPISLLPDPEPVVLDVPPEAFVIDSGSGTMYDSDVSLVIDEEPV